MHSKSYKSVAAASWRRNDCEGGRVVCAAETPSLTVGLLSQARTLTLAVLILNGLALPGGEAARESLGERLRLPARGERAQRARVGAPVLRVSGARAASAANLFAGRDQRAHPFGEFDDARLLAARHVDDGEAPAVAPAHEAFGEFEHRRRGVLDVLVVARRLARAFEPDYGSVGRELPVPLPHEQAAFRLAEGGEESADDDAQTEGLGVLPRAQLTRGLVEAVGRDGARRGVLARGQLRRVAIDGGARREDDERARAGAAHGVEHVGPCEDCCAQVVERRPQRRAYGGRARRVEQ